MSQVLGAFSSKPFQLKLSKQLSAEYSNLFKSNNLSLFLKKGISGNFSYELSPRGGKVLLGTAFKKTTNLSKVYSKIDDFNSTLGHFILLDFTQDSIKIQNDSMGTRSIYYCRKGNVFFFASNLKVLSEISGLNSPNYSAIASILYFRFNLDNDTVISGISKLMRDETLSINLNGLSIKSNDSVSSFNDSNSNWMSFENNLMQILKADFGGKRISLGLSAGYDSRLLFSKLVSLDISFDSHTFGFSGETDILVAKSICSDFNITHRIFTNPKTDNIISDINEYISFSPFPAAMHRVPFLFCFSEFNENQVVYDGSAGEFYRDYYFRKWRILRMMRIPNHLLFKYIHTDPMDFFEVGFKKMLYHEANKRFNDFENEFKKQSFYKNDYEMAYIDFYHTNYKSRDQARMDNYVESLMPLNQMNLVLSKLLSKNNKYFIKLIQNSIKSTGYPVNKIFQVCSDDRTNFYKIEKIADYLKNASSHHMLKNILNKKGLSFIDNFYHSRNEQTLYEMDFLSSFILTINIFYKNLSKTL